eukprot:40555-Chlamydomonas_euryale.AAC.10
MSNSVDPTAMADNKKVHSDYEASSALAKFPFEPVRAFCLAAPSFASCSLRLNRGWIGEYR